MRLHNRFSLIAAAFPVAAVLALGGCGGGGGSATGATNTTGRAAVLNVYVTDGFSDAYKQVQVTLFKIELTSDGTNFVTVFEDTAGRTLDLRSLLATTELLASVNVAAGTYTQARVTFADHFTLVNRDGASSSVAVDPTVGTAAGSGQIAVTVSTPTKVLADQAATLLLDFKLAKFQLVGNVLRPHVEGSGAAGLAGKLCDGHLNGTVANLSADGTTFDLQNRDGRTIHVIVSDATVITDGESGAAVTLANNQNVLVEGTFDTATSTVTAAAVTLHTPSVAHGPRAGGTIASVDAGAGTFVLTIERADGIQPIGGTITVLTNASTVFRKGRHAAGTFADLAVEGSVRVGGTFDAATQTLTATVVELSPGKDHGGSH